MFDHQHLSSIGEPRAASVYIYIYSNTLVDGIGNQQTSRHQWHTSGYQWHLQMEQWQMDTAAGSPVAREITASAGWMGQGGFTCYAKSMLGQYQWRHITKRSYTEYGKYMESELSIWQVYGIWTKAKNLVIYLQDHGKNKSGNKCHFQMLQLQILQHDIITADSEGPLRRKSTWLPWPVVRSWWLSKPMS